MVTATGNAIGVMFPPHRRDPLSAVIPAHLHDLDSARRAATTLIRAGVEEVIIQAGGNGASEGRNEGFRHVTNTLVVFADADTEVLDPIPDPLPPGDWWTGLYLDDTGDLFSSLSHVGTNIFGKFGCSYAISGGFYIIRGSVYSAIGGMRFNDHTDDIDMAIRLSDAGYRFGGQLPVRVMEHRRLTRWAERKYPEKSVGPFPEPIIIKKKH